MIFALILVSILFFRFRLKCTFEVAQIATSDGSNAPLQLLLFLAVLAADAACVAYAVTTRTEDVPSGCLAYSQQIAVP